jgi:hypothetical protein
MRRGRRGRDFERDARRPRNLDVDVHRAEGSSPELIAALVRRLPEARVLLVLAHRPRQAPARSGCRPRSQGLFRGSP